VPKTTASLVGSTVGLLSWGAKTAATRVSVCGWAGSRFYSVAVNLYIQCKIHFISNGRATVQVVFRQHVTAKNRLRFRSSAHEICGGLSNSNSVFPCQYHPISTPCSSLQTAIVRRSSGRSVVTLKWNCAIQEFVGIWKKNACFFVFGFKKSKPRKPK
jgi:hypothetical protein